ncbi:MAG: BatD family protein [Pseudohongiellaceae bacterium]|nr:BatD family protein [Pseudohongiellaceae bacterium]
MVKLLAYLLAATLSLLATQSIAQPVSATIDRTELVRGETILLSIRVDGQQGNVPMDLSPLQENFELVSTRTSSQIRAINNRTEAWITYNLTLFPRSEGELEVPSLEIAGETTQAFTINVLPKTDTSITDQDIYLETVVSKESIYVQEQLLFTIRLYYTKRGIRNPIFTDLDIPDTVIQQIGTPNQYEKLIDGNRYGVYEKNYALFPQRSGSIELPSIMFRGEVTDGSSNYVFRNQNTRTITAFAEGYNIEVKEKPADYPENAIWLPASEITIEQDWDNDFTNVRVGDAVNRLVKVEALGLDGAALPPLPENQVDTINIYPQTPDIERTYIDGNILGARIERSSLVPTETGTMRIPGYTLPWFDIDTEEIKYAEVADTAFRVGPVRTTGEPDTTIGSADASDTTTLQEADDNSPLSGPVQTPLWVIALVAAVGAALLALYYRFTSRSGAPIEQAVKPKSASPMYDKEITQSEERSAYDALVKASKADHLPALRLAIIAWGRQYFADKNLHTLDELASRTGDQTIKDICLNIQQALYGQSQDDAKSLRPQIESLIARITQLRESHNKDLARQRKEQDYTIPPLYKA